METHYIPPFTRQNGRKQEAVCGLYIRWQQHSNQPTCDTCLAYVQSAPERDSDDEETAKALEAEFPDLRGKLVTR